MMAESSDPSLPCSGPIISPQYMVPDSMHLKLRRNVFRLTTGNFTIMDINDNTIFEVKGVFWSLHFRKILYDAAGNPLASFSQKVRSLTHKWKVFRGESSDPEDLIFTAKLPSFKYNFKKAQLDVFLAANTTKEVCDYKLKGSWLGRSCVVYAGDSDTVVAQMNRKLDAKAILLDKDVYNVTVWPNIDYAFVAALMVILDDVNVTELP